MAETSINHLTTLVTLIEGSATGGTAAEDTPLQLGCLFITRSVQFQDAVLWLEENLPNFKERKEEPSG